MRLHRTLFYIMLLFFVASVFPYLTADSVLRSLSSRSTFDDKDADRRYVSEIEYEFKPVTDLMKKKD